MSPHINLLISESHNLSWSSSYGIKFQTQIIYFELFFSFIHKKNTQYQIFTLQSKTYANSILQERRGRTKGVLTHHSRVTNLVMTLCYWPSRRPVWEPLALPSEYAVTSCFPSHAHNGCCLVYGHVCVCVCVSVCYLLLRGAKNTNI